MEEFDLMHKNEICGRLFIDGETGHVAGYKDNGSGQSPYVGHSDLRKIKQWWEMRSAPASRIGILGAMENAVCYTAGLYLVRNLALSITDTYWLCPKGQTLDIRT